MVAWLWLPISRSGHLRALVFAIWLARVTDWSHWVSKRVVIVSISVHLIMRATRAWALPGYLVVFDECRFIFRSQCLFEIGLKCWWLWRSRIRNTNSDLNMLGWTLYKYWINIQKACSKCSTRIVFVLNIPIMLFKYLLNQHSSSQHSFNVAWMLV